MKKKIVRNGYESLLFLALVGIGSVIFTCCSSSSTPQPKTALYPSATPEMLIVRPTREPTEAPTPYPIVQTMTAALYVSHIAQTPTRGVHTPQNIYSPTPAPQRLGSASSSDGTCRIKGNVNTSTGERIYHCPGWRDYDKTDMIASEGDRYFCSEAEALAAGFREAKYSHGACRP